MTEEFELFSRAKIQRMTERLLSGEMSQEEFELFESILLNDDAARLTYVEHVSVHAHLSHLGGAMDLIEGGVFAHDDQLLAHESKHRSSLLLTASVAMLVSCLIVIPWLGMRFFLNPDPNLIGQLFEERVSLPENDHPAVSPGEVRVNVPLELGAATYALRLKNGIRCKLIGPARMQFASDMEADLSYGTFIATVPRHVVGFRVNTPETRVLDLGTTFSVEVARAGGTDVSVFEGLVVAQPQHEMANRGSLPILPGESLSFTKSGIHTRRSPQPEMLSDLHSLYGIQEVTGAVTLRVQSPESVCLGRLASDAAIHVIRECEDCVLTAPLQVVPPSRTLIKTPGIPSSKTLPRGTRCQSFLLHCDLAESKNSLQGSIRFEHPILGVIFKSDELQLTDPILGSGKISYPSSEDVFKRGFSRGCIAPHGGKGELDDSIQIHDDGYGLTVNLYAPDSNIDQIRVVVQGVKP